MTNDKMQKRFKTPHNCEQIPAENVSIKLAKKDQLLKYQNEYNIYSNQFIPLIVNADLLDRIKLQGIFDKHFSGGSILHISCDEKLETAEEMKLLLQTCASKGVIYFAVNYMLRRCDHGHMTVGSDNICPICGGKIEDFFTRVVGFLTNVKNWHKIRREEDAPNRQMYGNEQIGKVIL